MGCYTYTFQLRKGDGEWGECQVRFNEGSDIPCVCCFPCNNEVDEIIEGYDVLSLALLGACVAMALEGKLEEDYNYIPDCLPDWMVQGIKGKIRLEEE